VAVTHRLLKLQLILAQLILLLAARILFAATLYAQTQFAAIQLRLLNNHKATEETQQKNITNIGASAPMKDWNLY
jgi:hypothetical protein